uniref:NADH-ubiquinone oxidoreductase chain 2 n=1 Tax=Gammarus roeselii TaxID=1080772 RepID=A0A343VUM3_9CRUS|nr:NADH dehydrogenase subunit 2 [Gammarus roeselii]AVP50045.1 NADH dehydrogenase subunit 2 [Gammarus roeselii]
MSSIVITISANSWMGAWLGLEINLLSFIPLIISKKNKYSTESALKYFLIQALASILIIFSVNLVSMPTAVTLMLTTSLLLKSGAAPSHQWMPAVVEGLSWPLFAILTTLQKIGPLILVFFLLKYTITQKMVTLYATLSALVGSVGGLIQTSLRKIFAYSSITHLAWILGTLLCLSWGWLLYFTLYSLVMVSLISILNQTQLSTLNQLTTSNKSYTHLLLSMTMLSFSGLPPFTGFLPKLMAIQLLVSSHHSAMLPALLIGTFISLFFYVRLVLTSLMLAASSANNHHTPIKSNFTLVTINLIGLLVPPAYMVFL